MSLTSVNTAKSSVLDLLPAKKADGRGAIDRPDLGKPNNEGGFDRALRESSSKRGVDKPGVAEGREVSDRSEKEPAASSGEAESVSGDRAEKPDTDTDQGQAESSQKQGEKTQQADKRGGESAGQEDASQAEAGADAQAQAAQAAANVQALPGQSQNIVVQPGGEGEKQAAGGSSKQQSQAALQQAAAAANKPGNAQANTTQTQAQASATAVAQPVQAEDTAQSQTGGGEARGEGSSSAQATTTLQQGSANAATAAAFTVPDQASSEARLPISPTNTAQQAEVAKGLQAQPSFSAGDNDAMNTARLTRGMANAVQQRGGAVTLRLTPPEMGTVRIQMQITGTNVSASFHAESVSAQTLLTQQLSQLRSSLESQGMNVEKLSVQPMASTAQSNNAGQSQNNSDSQQQAQQQSANDGRSRGQYSGDSSGRSGRDGEPDDRSQQRSRRGFFEQLNDSADTAD